MTPTERNERIFRAARITAGFVLGAFLSATLVAGITLALLGHICRQDLVAFGNKLGDQRRTEPTRGAGDEDSAHLAS